MPTPNYVGLQLQPSEHVVFVVRDERGVLLDLNRGRYYLLNDTGAAIWSRLCDNIPTREIVESLVKEYNASAATVESETAAFLESLHASDLVTAK